MADFTTVFPRPGAGWEKWDAARADGCPPDITPLTVADMEFPSAPEIIDEVVRVAREGYWGYTGATEGYRWDAAAWMAAHNGWAPQPHWLVGTAGVVPAIYAAVRAFTKPGDGVLIQPPVYPPFFTAASAQGRRVVENPLIYRDGAWTMDFDDLRRKAGQAKMLVLCSPHNPVGRVWRRQELETLLAVCAENELILFSDEIHCDVMVSGAPFLSVGALDSPALARCLIGTSASKTFSLAGLGCSAIFVPDDGMRRRYEEQLGSEGTGFNTTFGIAATRAAYQKGAGWLAEMLATVGENARWLAGFTAENLPGVQMSPLEGTYLAWLDFNAWAMDDAALKAFMRKKAQFYVNPGDIFGAQGRGFVRVNIACPAATLQAAMGRLLAAAQAAGLA